MARNPLPALAGRVPRRWRRRVPLPVRNALVERLGHPQEPFDPARFPRKLNLGCGFDRREGYLNVDIHAFHEPDLVADVRELGMLPTGTYEEVLAQDVLEHLQRDDAPRALAEWRRLLGAGGRLRVRVPDLPSILDWLRESDDPDHHRRVLQFLFGTQAYDGDFHFSGYTQPLLLDDLYRAGFGDVEIDTVDGWMWDVTAVAGAEPRVVRSSGPPAAVDRGGYPTDREGVDNLHLELMLAWMLREDSNCIDIGANEGRFLWHITQHAPRGRHIAFEPLPHLAAQVRHAFPGVEVHEAALSDRAGEAEFVHVPASPGYSGLRERAYPEEWETERIKVKLERLDDALPEGYVPDLIKIDVEGAEREVISGGLETIRRHRPIVVFEHGVGAADRYGTTPEQIWDLLCGEAQLRLFDMDGEGPLSRERFAQIFAAGARWNFAALP